MLDRPLDFRRHPVRRRTLARMLPAAVAAAMLAAPVLVSAEEAIDIEAMTWAAACVTCHGAADDVEGSRISSLAGMPADEFVSRMKQIAASEREGALMPQLARGYDEDALVRMGKWFEKLGE